MGGVLGIGFGSKHLCALFRYFGWILFGYRYQHRSLAGLGIQRRTLCGRVGNDKRQHFLFLSHYLIISFSLVLFLYFHTTFVTAYNGKFELETESMELCHGNRLAIVRAVYHISGIFCGLGLSQWWNNRTSRLGWVGKGNKGMAFCFFFLGLGLGVSLNDLLGLFLY